MTEVLYTFLFTVIIALLVLLTMTIKRIAREIGELKEKLEQHRIMFNYLEFDYSSISDIEDRLDKLEELLELKEFYEQEPLNEETL